jgi:Protein kinase domain
LLARGTTLAGYRLDAILGKGGMGVVYEATQLSLNRTVAVKVLAPHLSDDPAFRERFRREGQIQAAIDHPNIVTVYEAGETEHGLFIAMRLVRGSTLKDMITAGQLDAGRSLKLLRPVADALDTAHEAGLIHRDVKPQNVLVAGRDHTYLADFGLTKPMGETGLTQTGQFVGTVDYISPEQIRGEAVTGRSDVYALAAVLFECLTGVVPYARDSDVAVLYAHMSDPAPKISEHRHDLPRDLDEVIAQGMDKQPTERFPTPGALLEAAQQAFDRHATPAAHAATVKAANTVSAEAAALPETQAAATAAAAAADPTVKAGLPPTVNAGLSPTADVEVRQTPAGPTAPSVTPPEGAPARASRVPLRGIAIAAAVLVVAIVGVVIGSSGSGGGSTAKASAGGLGLKFPSAWERSEAPVSIPQLGMASQIAVAPVRPVDGEAMVAGRVAAGGRLLLPDKFVKLLPAEPSNNDAVKLGNVQAYRYSALAPRGLHQRVTLFTVPASGGVATVACLFGPQTPSSFRTACERAAGSLEVTSGKHYPVGPSPSYASTLSATMAALNTAIKEGEGSLNAARTPAAQGNAAAALASAYDKAATRLGKLDLSPADADANSALVQALTASSQDYTAAAAAARRKDGAAYRRAGAEIQRDARATRQAVAAVEQLGYSLR